MDPLHVAHLVLVSLWGGLVLAEGVLELGARDDEALRHAARAHYALDLACELPLLVAVLATGGVLAARAWPWTPLLALKLGAGLVAVSANAACLGVVVARRRRLDDAAAVRRLSRLVRASGAAVPFALVAAYLGLAHFRG